MVKCINYHSTEKWLAPLGECSLDCQKDGHLEDLISQMPDIILANILSLLETREAGRSSVLSQRWRDLWKLTTILNFDYSETLRLLAGAKRERRRSRFKYSGWVNQVIELHQWPYLDEVKINFDFTKRFSSSVDKWVKFSIQKGAKKIDIDFLKHTSNYHRYTPSPECYAFVTCPSNKSSLKRLTSLLLRFVNINGQLMQYLFRSCPLLEYVNIWCSADLVELQVVSPSLKHLVIYSCSSMESLELPEAPKLRTLDYCGKELRLLRFGNLPLLSDLHLGPYSDHIVYALLPYSITFSRLETLELSLRWKDNEEIPEISELTNLKRLKLKIAILSGKSLLNLSKLIEAAPVLREFKMEMLICVMDLEAPTLVRNPRPRLSLKHVEILGFLGYGNVGQFIEYLLQCATDVQTVIIDPNYSGQPEAQWSKETKKCMAYDRRDAWKLKRLVPPGANFMVK